MSPFCETKSATLNEWQEIARELLALRKAFSEPAAYEVKGLLCHTLEEAEIYVGEHEPLYRKP